MNSILFSILAVIADQKVPLQRDSPLLLPPPPASTIVVFSSPVFLPHSPPMLSFRNQGLEQKNLFLLLEEGVCAVEYALQFQKDNNNNNNGDWYLQRARHFEALGVCHIIKCSCTSGPSVFVL